MNWRTGLLITLAVLVLGGIIFSAYESVLPKRVNVPEKIGSWDCDRKNYAVNTTEISVFAKPDDKYPYLILQPGNLVEIMERTKGEGLPSSIVWLRLNDRMLGIPNSFAWIRDEGVFHLPCVPTDQPYVLPPG